MLKKKSRLLHKRRKYKEKQGVGFLKKWQTKKKKPTEGVCEDERNQKNLWRKE